MRLQPLPGLVGTFAAAVWLLLLVGCGKEPAPPEAPPSPERPAPTALAPEPTPATPDAGASAPAPEPAPGPDIVTPAVAPGPSPEELAAQVALLKTPREVLEVFLSTRSPHLRHALLTARGREQITPEGLHTFYADAPGLLDLPLPLAPTGYELDEVSAPDGSSARFFVRARLLPEKRERRRAYYTLQREDGGPRVVWDRRVVGIARLALGRGEYREAEELASEILRWSPRCGDCEEILFWAQSRRAGGKEAWSRAGVHARRAVDWEPELASHRNALGVYYRNQRMYQSSERELKRATEIDPDSPAAGNIALLLEHQGQRQEALKAVDRYVERHPAELWGHLTRCRLLKRLDRYDEAVRACRTALDLRQSTDELAHVDAAHYLLAYSLHRLGKAEEALPEIEKAISYRPGYWLYIELKEQLTGVR